MKKLLAFLIVLFMFTTTAFAAPNTGTLPDNGVKINFNEDGSIHSQEFPDGWAAVVGEDTITIWTDGVTIELYDFVFKDEVELIGFSWTIEGASAEFWVKHGRTEAQYDGEFVTSDNKGISNVVWLVTVDEDDDNDEDDDEDDDDEIDDEDEDDDDEEDVDDDNEDDDDEIVDEDEEDEEDEEIIEEDEEEEIIEEEDEEELPDLGATGIGTGLGLGLSGLLGLWLTRKKKE